MIKINFMVLLCFIATVTATDQFFSRLTDELVRLEKQCPQKNCHSALVPLFEGNKLACWLKATMKRNNKKSQWVMEYRSEFVPVK